MQMKKATLCPPKETDINRNRVQNLKRGSRRRETWRNRRIIQFAKTDVWAEALAQVS